MRLLQRCVVRSLQRLGGEDTFIEVDHHVAVRLELLDPGFDLLPPGFILGFLGRVNVLHHLYLLALDLVHLVELAKKGGVDAVVTEVAVEEDAALLEGLASPASQDFGISEVFDVLWFQEPVTISLPGRQLLSQVRLSSGHHLPLLQIGQPP